jgi:hypothetical protein
MIERVGFRIVYENPHLPVETPEPFEDYDLRAAMYGYLGAGARAIVAIDGYSLEMTRLKIVDLVRSSMALWTQLHQLPPDSADDIRAALPDLPHDTRIYVWLFPDFMLWLPVIIFATDGTTVRIYTRTHAETEDHPLIVWPERDLAEPVLVLHAAVLEELRVFLTRYLEDLAQAIPFMRDHPEYFEWRARLA